ncbi:flagellin N-terminal helical domain-containing protein [Paenibacillus sp. TH7-28]
MIVSHNIVALTTANNLKQKNAAVSKNSEKLSSGLRINRAANDAAGLKAGPSGKGGHFFMKKGYD